ncbi:PREDICTED: SKI family transcriptional corepressor 2-like [Camelina sativa]|uniref:SKI family transcriptional corepressor 2-like n=1 Tax=Camelina sativa TaxID=90675 RepID=A0ABM0X0A8_CAMSA|nr:PREDICTED: SKI family transcriptional corepressor 2-like [Camelina sativa]
MFSSNNRSSTPMTCGFKVDTKSPSWHKSMTKVLKKIKGGNFSLDTDEGMAYVSGRGDPKELLKVVGSMNGNAAEMTFVKTGGYHHYDHHHHHHHQYPNNPQYPNPHDNSNFCYGQPVPQPYNSYWPCGANDYSQQHRPYYPQSPAMQPHPHQYPYPGYSNHYGYY